MFANVTALSVGAIFAVSAASKWLRPSAGTAAIAGYGVVPPRLLRPAAGALLLAETAVAVILLLAVVLPAGSTLVALIAAAVLFTLFAAVVARARSQERTIPCGCLGDVVELRLGWTSVALNAAAAVCAAIAAVALTADPMAAKAWIVACECAVLVAVAYWLTIYGASVRGLVGQDLSRRAVS